MTSTSAMYTLHNGRWYSKTLGIVDPAPPPPPPNGVHFGSFTDGGDTGWLDLKADVGQGWVRRSYNSGMVPASWTSSSAAADTVTGPSAVPISMYSFKPATNNEQGLLDITAGVWDSRINSFLDSIPDTVVVNGITVPHITILLLWHEPDNDFAPKGANISPQAWKDANAHFFAMVKGKGRSTLRTAICSVGNFTFQASHPLGDPDTIMWDVRFVTLLDYIGIDVYIKLNNYAGQTGTIPFYERSTADAMPPCEVWAASHNKQIIIPELAWNENQADPTAKAAEMEIFRNRAISKGYFAVCYFDSYTGGVHYNLDHSFKLRSSTNATTEWASIQTRSS